MAIGALTMVGFVSMIINIIGLCITYSLYLTLHKFITVSYIVFIVIAILIELLKRASHAPGLCPRGAEGAAASI